VGDDPFFCCSGCAVVYEALRDAGFEDTFYRLRDLAPDQQGPQPAQTRVDPLHLSELDTPAFLDEHTEDLGDGLREIELFLDGVHCAACVWLVERLPYELDGVVAARLDLPRARLTLHFEPDHVNLSEVARWLARFGYQAHPSRADGLAHRSDVEQRLLIKTGVCWALAGNVMLLAFALYAGLNLADDPTMAAGARWTSLALATISVLYGGSEFFKRAWASLRLASRTRDVRSLHMDTPISLGILVGYGHSAWATVTGTGDVWFDSITVLIAALLTARWLQLRSRRLAGDATDRLLSLIPSMARRCLPDGAHEVVRIEDIAPGDYVQIPAGEVIPVDGIVTEGTSQVNNAVLTGESRPEETAPGTTVEAGATNLTAPLVVQVAAAGKQTRVGKLLAWIRDQESKQADVVLLADRLSGYFVGGVLVLAVATALLWSLLDPTLVTHHVVALLVISCPCALGMATPLAMAVAAGRAARSGIFIKSDAATQQLTTVDTLVVDKTGTLTQGRMTLIDVAGDASVLDLAAAVETHSNHPIAAALLQATGTCSLDGSPAELPTVSDVEAIAGSGVRGRVQGQAVAVGRPAWIAGLTGPLSDGLAAQVGAYAAAGYTPVAVAMGERCMAVLAFGDRLRDDSKAMLDTFRAAGHDVYLLSGDHDEVVQAVARQLDLPPEVAFGHVSPEDKRAFVERLQGEQGATVAMIGDGVNDAAALQAADVGIAVQGGSSPSLVAADVFLTREGLRPVATLLQGSHQVMRVIRRNLGLSLVYNLTGAALAMAGLVTPLVAAVAMPLSSLAVVTLSVTQRSFRSGSPPTAPAPQSSAMPEPIPDAVGLSEVVS
jgi:Cu2+-exporting ATPase